MDFKEKAKIRMEHWLAHGRSHGDDYAKFTRELTEAGQTDSAAAMEEMARLNDESLKALEKALEALA